tara:strand:- start:264 stop:374 length:111 start_codon:yes stop_codon:yes gene_type:complete
MEQTIAMVVGITWCVILAGSAIYAFIEYLFLKNENK